MSIVRLDALKAWRKKIDHELHALSTQLMNVVTFSDQDNMIQFKIQKRRILREGIDEEIEYEESKINKKSDG